MATTRRTKVRISMMALIVSFLRDGTINSSLFSAVPAATSKYPFTQDVWGFTIDGEFLQIILQEASEDPLERGVTLQFGIEQPADSKSMPQRMNLKFGIVVRVPLTLDPSKDSLSQQIALKIDQALYETAGRLTITDYYVDPAVAVTNNPIMSWVKKRRQEWEYKKTKSPMEELRMMMDMEYAQPQEEW